MTRYMLAGAVALAVGMATRGDFNAIEVKTAEAQPTPLDPHVGNVLGVIRESKQVMLRKIQDAGGELSKIEAAVDEQKEKQKKAFADFESLRRQEYRNLQVKKEEPVEARAGVARKERKSIANSYRIYPPNGDWQLAERPKLDEAVRFGSVDAFHIEEWRDENNVYCIACYCQVREGSTLGSGSKVGGKATVVFRLKDAAVHDRARRDRQDLQDRVETELKK